MAGSYQYAYVKFYESDLEEIAMDVLSGDEFEMGYIYCPGRQQLLHAWPTVWATRGASCVISRNL